MPTVLVYGDSNSHGTPPMAERGVWTRMEKAKRWPYVTQRALGEEWEVIVEALPGRTTVQPDPVEGEHKNGLTPLRAILDSHAPLDMVVLMLGTNDLKMRFNLPAVDIAMSVGRLVEVVQASGAARDVTVVCPAPVRECGCLTDVFQGAETRGAGLFVYMMQEAARRGCGFVDAGAHVSVDPLDGVHLDARSHAVLGAAMAEALRDRWVRLEQGHLE
jgi:lysophospholipase L1-like esterase